MKEAASCFSVAEAGSADQRFADRVLVLRSEERGEEFDGDWNLLVGDTEFVKFRQSLPDKDLSAIAGGFGGDGCGRGGGSRFAGLGFGCGLGHVVVLLCCVAAMRDPYTRTPRCQHVLQDFFTACQIPFPVPFTEVSCQ